MNEPQRLGSQMLFPALAIVFGLLVAAFDVAVPFGDDTEKGTVFLWVICCGLLGFLRPTRPWRWACLVGLWVPAAHLVLHALDLPDSINPNDYATILVLVPVSLAICALAAWSGAFVRHLVRVS